MSTVYLAFEATIALWYDYFADSASDSIPPRVFYYWCSSMKNQLLMFYHNDSLKEEEVFKLYELLDALEEEFF